MEIGPVDRPKVILAVGAHPDDMEFTSAGSLIRWVQEGCTVHYLICTDGDKGTKDLSIGPGGLTPTRVAEQREAARRIGVSSVTFLHQGDGEFEATRDNCEKITRVIRELRPDVLMGFDPWRRYQLHPDHRAVGLCTLDAMVAARDHLFFPHLYQSGLMPHTVPEILLYATDDPNAWVDISGTFAAKMHALRAHASQVGHIADIEERLLERARLQGQAHGLELAEEFHRIEQR